MIGGADSRFEEIFETAAGYGRIRRRTCRREGLERCIVGKDWKVFPRNSCRISCFQDFPFDISGIS
jgi:hypothetical protein